jgi:hypothetical protein
LEKRWRDTTSRANGKCVSVDVDGVTFIDNQGKILLTGMDSAGVELIANGCMMRWIVQRIATHGVNSLKNTA